MHENNPVNYIFNDTYLFIFYSIIIFKSTFSTLYTEKKTLVPFDDYTFYFNIHILKILSESIPYITQDCARLAI